VGLLVLPEPKPEHYDDDRDKFGPLGTRALTARLEAGFGGAAVGVGFDEMLVEKCMVFGHAGVELRALRTYGNLNWRDATYVGPQVSLGLAYFDLTLGLMFDVTDVHNAHPQIGFGFGI
jgi:hypothetical protein